MCLEITEKSLRETKELKAQQKPIVAYKILDRDLGSQFQEFQWEFGENKSGRESADLTEEELEEMKVDEGFHFVLEKPEECPEFEPDEDGICHYQNLSQNQYQCPYQYQCLYLYHFQYPCQSSKSLNKIFRVEIQPEDLIAVGSWNGFKSLAATKCKLVKE